jgi:multiple sugar transport system substrate-binding protein
MRKLIFACVLLFFAACASEENPTPSLDPSSPVTITVWHYYNGAVMNAFDAMVNEFNETLGMERGIIVEGIGKGNMGELERAVTASANDEIGSLPLPNIFASFPSTAYAAQERGLLADLDEYFTAEQQAEYFVPFMDRGRIGDNGELRIFPVSMSTEIMILNETDWTPFAEYFGLSLTQLETMEGLAAVAQLYYNWSDGRAFWGRDSMANFFVMTSKQFGTEIFQARDGRGVISINEEAMRRIWDFYYVPFISGYFASHGRFRSEDVRVGEILGYVGSTVSAVFFPANVTIDGESRPIEAVILPAPLFEGGDRVMVNQGAGMVVSMASAEERYASLLFLRWFTEPAQNLRFSALSGYMPVRTVAMYPELIREAAANAGITMSPVTDETLEVALTAVRVSEMYSTTIFTGATEARAVLYTHLQNRAVADRATVLEMIESGTPRDEAIAYFAAYENFRAWVSDLEAQLLAAVE